VYDFAGSPENPSMRICNEYSSVDIGAYEVQFENPTLVVNSSLDVVDKTDGVVTLREALIYAQDYPQLGATITFADDVEEIRLTSALTIDADVVIAAANRVVLNAADAEIPSRVIEVAKGVAAELENLTITGGRMIDLAMPNNPDYAGGGVYNQGDLTLRDVSIVGNEAAYGGGLYNTGSLTVVGSEISGNSAQYYGGAYTRGPMSVVTTKVFGNYAEYDGGGLGAFTANLDVVNSAVYANYAKLGAGVYFNFNPRATGASSNSSLKVVNSTFAGNVAADAGAEMWVNATKTTLVNSIFYGGTVLGAADDTGEIVYTSKSTAFAYDMIGDAKSTISGTGVIRGVDPMFMNFERPTLDAAAWTADPKGSFNAWIASVDWDLALQTSSPAKDAGSNTYVPADITTDLNGDKRIVGKRVDLGAYEEQGNVAPSDILVDVRTIHTGAQIGDVVATAKVVDENEGDAFTFTLSGPDAQYFDIVEVENGVVNIVLAQQLGVGTYKVELTAEDASGETVSKTIEMKVVEERYATPIVVAATNVNLQGVDVFWETG
ncbi:MAG: hypothetical protein HUK22_03725, partial [Thermoguttaceae bacterium]|nr:hypothetical protein [Thermoguttaceae bacterium]